MFSRVSLGEISLRVIQCCDVNVGPIHVLRNDELEMSLIHRRVQTCLSTVHIDPVHGRREHLVELTR